MNNRHRVPSIFNLSMVDVLCCALGCVILLWLMNFRDAKQRRIQAGETALQLEQLKTILESTQNEYNDTLAQLSKKDEQIGQLTLKLKNLQDISRKLTASLQARIKDYEATASLLKLTRREVASLKSDLLEKDKNLTEKDKILLARANQIEDLRNKLQNSEKLVAALTDKLELSNDSIAALKLKMNASQKQMANLSGQLDDATKTKENLTAKLSAALQEQKALTSKLLESNKLVAKLEQLVGALRLESKDYATKFAKSQEKSQELDQQINRHQADLERLGQQLETLLKEKKLIQQILMQKNLDLASANAKVLSLQAEQGKLLQQQQMIKAAADNRFAGITLTGKRVIFLIDISGSMSMRDSQTDAPDKWPIVIESIGKLMKSLPDLTHYQVILFAETVIYPMGSQRQWLEYDPKSSADMTMQRLRQIKPTGGTKMRPAFDEAFRYRDLGLDTIYLVSDGLPNEGDNLPPEVARLEGVQRTAYLANQVRDLLKQQWNRPDVNGKRVSINAIGFFFESPEVGAFLWALARENDGSFVGMSRP